MWLLTRFVRWWKNKIPEKKPVESEPYKMDVPRYANDELREIRDLSLENYVRTNGHRNSLLNQLGELWDHPRMFGLLIIVFLGLVPAGVILFVSFLEGTIYIEDQQVVDGSTVEGFGILDAPVYWLQYTVVLLLLTAIHSLRSLRETLNSAAGFARLKGDSNTLNSVDVDDRFKSRLTGREMNQLFDFYEFVIAKLTFRANSTGVALPGERWKSLGERKERLKDREKQEDSKDEPAGGAETSQVTTDGSGEDIRDDLKTDGGGTVESADDKLIENFQRTWLLWFRIPYFICVIGGLAFFFYAEWQHWFSVETYGGVLYSSQYHLGGFITRAVFDFAIYVIIGPYVAIILLACILLMHHCLTRMERKNGIRFLRFSMDEAGGFGEFGEQSLRNTFMLLPILITISGSIILNPLNMLTVAGTVVFLLTIPTVFFWPLLGARRSMKRMKKMELEFLSKSLVEQYSNCRLRIERLTTDSWSDEAVNEFTRSVEVVENAESIYRGVKEQPAWPFDRRLLTQLVSIVSAAGAVIATALGV